MVKKFLPRKSADTSAENGEKEEFVFADTPLFMDWEIFIYPEGYKGEEVQSNKKCNKVIHIEYYTEIMIVFYLSH